MGSGSTLVAAMNTNRSGIGIELDEKYFEIAKNRIVNNNKMGYEILDMNNIWQIYKSMIKLDKLKKEKK